MFRPTIFPCSRQLFISSSALDAALANESFPVSLFPNSLVDPQRHRRLKAYPANFPPSDAMSNATESREKEGFLRVTVATYEYQARVPCQFLSANSRLWTYCSSHISSSQHEFSRRLSKHRRSTNRRHASPPVCGSKIIMTETGTLPRTRSTPKQNSYPTS